MAGDAIVLWRGGGPLGVRRSAILLRVALHALPANTSHGGGPKRFFMRVVTSEATQGFATGTEALAHAHLESIFVRIRFRRFSRLRGNIEECVDTGRVHARAKIRVLLSGLQEPNMSILMTVQTNLLGDTGRQVRGVHNDRISFRGGASAATLRDMQLARTMTILASNRHLAKRRLGEESGPVRRRLRSAAVTQDAPGLHQPAEPEIVRLISGR